MALLAGSQQTNLKAWPQCVRIAMPIELSRTVNLLSARSIEDWRRVWEAVGWWIYCFVLQFFVYVININDVPNKIC